MNKQRLALLITSGLGMLATFLPWVNVPFAGAIPGTKGDGWFTFAFFAVSLIAGLTGDRTKLLTKGVKSLSAGFGLLSAILGIWKIVNFNLSMGEIGGGIFVDAFKSSVSIGFGLYLVVIAGVGVFMISVVSKWFSSSET